MQRTLMLVMVTIATLLVAPAAHAGPATGSHDVGKKHGEVLRAVFRQNVDGSGYRWRTYGSGNCTATTADADFSWSDMDSDKNRDNVVSWIRDEAQCDVKIYQFPNFNTALTGYVHYGTNGQSLSGTGLNNLTSSYRVS